MKAIVDQAPVKPVGDVERGPADWRMLCSLLGTDSTTIHVSQMIDPENGERAVTMIVYTAERQRRSFMARTLEEAMMGATCGVQMRADTARKRQRTSD